MFVRSQSPLPTDSDPFGRFNFSFVEQLSDTASSNNATLADLEILITHHSLLDDAVLGLKTTAGFALCCTPAMAQDSNCNVGKLLIPDQSKISCTNTQNPMNCTYEGDTPMWYWSEVVDKSLTLADSVSITKSGVYYFYVLNCDAPVGGASLLLSGETEWRNPYGYLPGSIVYWLPVYYTFAILYCMLFAYWCVLVVIHKDDIMGLQIAITLVILVGGIESLVWAIDYTIYNRTGQVSDGFNIVGAFMTSLKQTLGRLILLFVSIGYTITRPSLNWKEKGGIAAVIGIYFFFIMAWQYTLVVEAMGNDVPDAIYLGVIFFSTLVNFAIFAWIFFAIYFMMQNLKSTKQMAKYVMYQKLAIILGIALGTAVVMFALELIITWAGKRDDAWRGLWVFDFYWELIVWVVLTIIAIIWRPTGNNKRYAYSEQLNADDDGIELEDTDAAVAAQSPEQDSSSEEEEEPSVSVVALDATEDIDLDMS